jgi:hypothetical protein
MQRTRRTIEAFEEEIRTTLGDIRESQKETNRLLWQHLAHEES